MLRRIALPLVAVLVLFGAAVTSAPLTATAQAPDEEDFLESLAGEGEADATAGDSEEDERASEAEQDDRAEATAEETSELAEDAPGEPMAAGEEARTDHGSLEQIRVVARRRSENLEDTPVSVTALGRTQLDDAQVREMNQIQDLVPNLTWVTGASGQGGSVIVRGVGKGAEDLVFDPGVGIYIDGVLLSRDAGQLMSMIDVEQIEVLRGPQGTLFGKNNVGGAINVITVKPQPEFGALALVGYGNLHSVRTRAMVNMPITDETLFMRVAWASEVNDGYMTNADTGQQSSDVRQLSTMGSLRALPTENLTIDVSGSWSRNHAHSRGGKCVYIGQSVANQFVSGGAIPPSEGGLAMGELEQECNRSLALPNDEFTSDVALLADIESYGVWGNIAYELGTFGIVENVVARSLTAWREQKPRLRDDTDMTSIPIIQRNLLAGPPTFFPDLKDASTQRQITQEFQLQNTWWGERIHSTTGLYLYWDQAQTDQELWSLGGQYVAPAEPFIGLTPSLQLTSIDNDDIAVYHQSTWDIVDELSLTAGVRWTQERKRTGLEIYRYTDPPPDGIPSSPFRTVNEADSETYREWTPTVSLVGKTPSEYAEIAGFDTLNAYFTYARGFKGGGFSAVQGGVVDSLIPFEPEFLDSWELGIKSVAWQHRLRMNLAGFWGRYKDQQVTVTRPGATPFQVERVVENAAKSKTRGVEFELQSLPAEGLLVTASIGYLNAYFEEYTNSARNEPRPIPGAPDPNIDRSGDRFNNAPRLQTNLTAQYEMRYEAGPRWAHGSVTPRLEWIYESAVWLAGREATSLHQGYVNRLNTRLSWRFNDEQSEVALWVKNLTDAYYFRSGIAGTISTYGVALRYYEPPRTYGFELSHRF